MAAELLTNQVEAIPGLQATEILRQAIENHRVGVMTHLSGGKWKITRVSFVCVTEQTLVLEILQNDRINLENLQINQPVGMSFQMDFTKYIFESSVFGFETKINHGMNGRILLDIPDKIEKMQRRAYFRQSAPRDLLVKVLFWHRGYLDQVHQSPAEHYWQGTMVDLSAGGMRISMALELKNCFTVGQLLGIQFTPMCYQKPVMVEGHIRYLREDKTSNRLYIGAEFLGLEASVEGRQILHRLLSIVADYQRLNEQPSQQTS